MIYSFFILNYNQTHIQVQFNIFTFSYYIIENKCNVIYCGNKYLKAKENAEDTEIAEER
jgi:hypothetical protein